MKIMKDEDESAMDRLHAAMERQSKDVIKFVIGAAVAIVVVLGMLIKL